MLRRVTTLGMFALGACTILPSAFAQQGNGPVREGLKRTGEAVANTGRAAARATGEAVKRTGEAARNSVERTGDAARRLTGRNSANANTRIRTEQGYSQNDTRAMTDQNGQTTAADQQNQQPYTSNYRGEEGNADNVPADPQPHSSQDAHLNQTYNNGRAYTLRHDSQGREFICVCGQRVYFDNQASTERMIPSESDQDWNTQAQGDKQNAPEPQEYTANRPLMDSEQAETDLNSEAAAEPSTREEGESALSEQSERLRNEADAQQENLRENTSDLQSDDLEAPVISDEE